MADRLAIFNHPEWNPSGKLVQADGFLVEQLIALFTQAEEGSQIRIAVAGWTVAGSQLQYDALLGAIKGALSRGCDLKVIGPLLGSPDPGTGDVWYQLDASSGLAAELKAMFRGNIRFWPKDQGACGGSSHSHSHNTFVLFSQLRGAATKPKWVLADMSAQWRPSARERPNDMMLFAEERGLYLAYLRYWQALWMAAGGAQRLPHHLPTFDDPDSGVTVHFQSQEGEGKDPLIALLESVLLTSETRIFASMAAWGYTGRGKSLLDKLLSLSTAGCDVRVIAHHQLGATEPGLSCPVEPGDPGDGVGVGLCETSSVVWAKLEGQGKIRWAKSATHSKYLLIEGPFIGTGTGTGTGTGGGGETQQVVIACRQGFRDGGVDPALSDGCDVAGHLLVIRDDPEIFQRYLDNWSWLCGDSWLTSTLSPCG